MKRDDAHVFQSALSAPGSAGAPLGDGGAVKWREANEVCAQAAQF